MICECGHVGGVGVRETQHLNGTESCVVAGCDCQAFDAVSLTLTSETAVAIGVASKALLDAANALRLAGLDYLANCTCQVQLQRQLNSELHRVIRKQRPSAVEVTS